MTQVYRLVEAALGFKGHPLAPDVYIPGVPVFLPLIEAASRPAGLSGICREVVRHLSWFLMLVRRLSGICLAFVRPDRSLRPLRRPERLTEPRRGHQDGFQPWFGWPSVADAAAPDGWPCESP